MPSYTYPPTGGTITDPVTGNILLPNPPTYTPNVPAASPVPYYNTGVLNPGQTPPPNAIDLGDGTYLFFGGGASATPAPVATPAPTPNTNIGLPPLGPTPVPQPQPIVAPTPATDPYADGFAAAAAGNGPDYYSLGDPAYMAGFRAGIAGNAAGTAGTATGAATPPGYYTDQFGNPIDPSTGAALSPASIPSGGFTNLGPPPVGFGAPTPDIVNLPPDLFPGANVGTSILGGPIDITSPPAYPLAQDFSLTGGPIDLGGPQFVGDYPAVGPGDTGSFPFTGSSTVVDFTGESPQYDAAGNLIGTGITVEPDILPGNLDTTVADIVGPGVTVDNPFIAPTTLDGNLTPADPSGAGFVSPTLSSIGGGQTLTGGPPTYGMGAYSNPAGGTIDPNAPGSAGIPGSNASYNDVLGSLAQGPAATVQANVVLGNGNIGQFDPSTGGYVDTGVAAAPGATGGGGATGGFGVGAGATGVTPAGFSTGYTPFGGGGVGPQFSGDGGGGTQLVTSQGFLPVGGGGGSGGINSRMTFAFR